MEQRKEEVTRRPLYVYDLPPDILSTLARKDGASEGPQEDSTLETAKTEPVEPRTEDAVGSKACSLCGVSFHTVADQRSHVRSDLHGYNLKQRIRGGRPVTEAEFEKMIGDLDESLSGSDSSDSEDEEDDEGRKETTLSALLKKQAAISSSKNGDADDFSPAKRKRGSGKTPLLWFTTPTLPTNTYLGIYRAIFTNAEQEKEPTILDIIQKKQLYPKPQKKVPTDSNNGVPLPEAYKGPHIFLCMIGGGHFAAMVVSLEPRQTKSSATGPLSRDATVLAHKTFHRYTTRRKQGGSQSANDNAKGAAHSAGSSLRRYNEQALTDEVRLLLSDWKGMIDTSELLFIRATGSTNRRTLFGPYDGQVLRQNDPRIRGFPFSTRRATQNELLRSFVELTRVKVLEVDEAAIAAAKVAAEAAAQQASALKANKQSAPTKPKLSEEEEEALLHTGQLQALVRRSKVPALLSYLKNNELLPDFRFHPLDSKQNFHAPTPLHLAASQNSAPLVSGLLNKAGADPTVLNGDGKTAFDLSGDRATRDAFRVSRQELGENKWDWEAAHVASAISKAEAGQRDKREKAEEAKKEEDRRKAEATRLKEEGPKIPDTGPLGKAAGRGRAIALQKTAQEKTEEEMRGMTPEMKLRVEREKRAKAAEERMKRMAGK
ncbi:uncharacterized protein LY89DRAFT_676095 [Mollisia scopiformis]|uniref:VLRF1 domain-containing protein n=1 Tax=Mollisia scopiformis TaxID=149040 RepID=A0A132BBR5_MOLSC|nr:uncharacterized protein LY89DRAFT_676095 [Mollisia scopiformis]KUJ09284.1 hypothetical protein LY89DRAFT_676095 [Mollisia scopiformis]